MFQESIGSRNKYEKKMAKHNEEIIYFVSSIVILLNVNKGVQRFYSEHTEEIISMAICNLNGDIVATGDMSENKPSIHIWNSRNLENINVLQGIHNLGIHLLAFSSDDKFLITCGLGNPSAILIYDWKLG
jgi:WD40 repeat protein